MKTIEMSVAIFLALPAATGSSADLTGSSLLATEHTSVVTKGRASAISGDALWFPQFARKVRLAGVEACALPQWAFDPSLKAAQQPLAPVPCGSFGKAWLKRAIGNNEVSCHGASFAGINDSVAHCSVRGRDLGYEMLRVGWARIKPGGQADARYVGAERYARSARYGLWGTYVLDMAEWQQKAIDRTLQRQPHADGNLLRERSQEITPPFDDLRNRPSRTDR